VKRLQTVNKQSLTIDIRKRAISSTFVEKSSMNHPIPQFVQGDTNIIEAVIQDNGESADLSAVGKVVGNFKRQDNKVVSRSAVVSGNVVTYTLGNEEMIKAGIGELELQFFNTDESERLSTLRFKVNVTPEIGFGLEGTDGPTLAQELIVNGQYAEEQGNIAKQSAEEAISAKESAITNWLSPVADYSSVEAIANPSLGATVQTNDNGYVYRFDGTEWVNTQQYGATALANVNAQLAETEQQINKINAPKISPIEIIAHRGFAELAPENTMSAYSQAVSIGATSLECDVQITSDGVPVVIHDSSVNRTTGSTGNVKEMTLAQLRALDAGSYFSPYYAGSKIPTFDEFLKYAKGRSLRVYPEIKDIRTIADIELMVNVIKDNGMENVTVIQSFNLDHLLEVRKFSETIKLGLLIYNTALSQYAIDTLSNDGNAMILYGYSYIISNPSLVNQFYDLGIDVGVWVVPNKQTTLSLLELGVTKQMFDLYIGGIA
jgi:glycerophosphoryl diester phosphodiesterase